MLCHVAKLVNEGFYTDGGRIRGVPVTIGGTSFIPPIPLEPDIIASLNAITAPVRDPVDTAIELCLYCIKAQIFNDGNKRAAIIYANHWLIAHAGGLLVIPESAVPEFKQLLVEHYEGRDDKTIRLFLKENCWRSLK